MCFENLKNDTVIASQGTVRERPICKAELMTNTDVESYVRDTRFN